MFNVSDFIKPTPKQLEAHEYIGKGHRVFFGGARGGGKSHFGLMEAVVQGKQHPGLTSVLIRATYNELVDNFIEKLALHYPEEIFGYHYVDKTKTATFSNGSAIKFRACDSQRAIKKVQGIEYQFMVIDEANNFDEATIHDLSGSLRRTSRIKTFIPTLLMTGNPGGLSDLYFKSRFVNPDYKAWRDYELRHKNRYIFIPAKAADNPHVGEEYVDWLDGLPDHRRLAWKEGSWDVYEGQFFEEWNEPIHVCAPFAIPDHWDRVMSIDLGYTSHPTVCLWGAQDPQTGTVYIYREYSAISVATEIHIRQIASLRGDEYISRFFGDPSMFTVKQDTTMDESPANMFLREQLPLIAANNDRVNGWRVVKQWLHWDANHKPKLQIFETCRNLITTLPTLKYDVGLAGRKEDLNTRMQDDAADALRYMLMSAYGYPTAGSQMLSESIEAEIRSDLMDQGYSEQFIQERIWDAKEGKVYRRGYEEECWVSPRSYYI